MMTETVLCPAPTSFGLPRLDRRGRRRARSRQETRAQCKGAFVVASTSTSACLARVRPAWSGAIWRFGFRSARASDRLPPTIKTTNDLQGGASVPRSDHMSIHLPLPVSADQPSCGPLFECALASRAAMPTAVMEFLQVPFSQLNSDYNSSTLDSTDMCQRSGARGRSDTSAAPVAPQSCSGSRIAAIDEGSTLARFALSMVSRQVSILVPNL